MGVFHVMHFYEMGKNSWKNESLYKIKFFYVSRPYCNSQKRVQGDLLKTRIIRLISPKLLKMTSE